MTVHIFAPAKLNLSLHVTGQRDDGYHLLDSMVVFLDVGDQVTLEPAQKTSLTVSGPMAKGVPTDASNLMVKAAELAGAQVTMHLEKRLPPSSGIGGGSADAAATLRGLRRLGLGAEVSASQALSLGADIPACLRGTALRMGATGEKIDPLSLPPLHLVLVNPRVEVSTPSVFKALEKKENMPMPDIFPDWPDSLAFVDWLTSQRNDLQKPAVKQAPEIAAALTAIALTPGVLLTRMSGSGATCFGVFETRKAAEEAADRLASSNPWWWVKAASSLP